MVQQVTQQQQDVQQVFVVTNTVQQTVPPPPIVGTTTTPPSVLSTTDNFQVIDEANNTAFHTPGRPFTGTIAGVQNEYVNLNPTNLDVTAITPSAFIKTGDGNDTLASFFGRNVLDAGGGSNVMIGGVGKDTFLASVTDSSNNVVDLLKNFGVGDDAVIRGLSASDFSLNFNDTTGAFGKELQITATPNNGGPSATVAFAGYSTGDIASGRLTISFSQEQGSNTPFMLVHANS